MLCSYSQVFWASCVNGDYLVPTLAIKNDICVQGVAEDIHKNHQHNRTEKAVVDQAERGWSHQLWE